MTASWQAAAPWRIGVDVGGTFTDLVMVDNAGAMRVFKAPSVPEDPGQGVLAALDLAAQALGRDVGGVLAACSFFIHGSTVATNTVLEAKGARVGLITTAGFRDTLEIRRGLRADVWDHRTPYPPVLVPRYLRLPVRGRMDATGTEIAPLSDTDIEAAGATFRTEGVQAVAVCLLHAYANPAHERRVRAVLAERLGDVPISLSSEVAPVIGEYARSATTVMNAYLAPRVGRYLRALDERLRALGLPRAIFLLQSNGGAASIDQLAPRPAALVLSGPAAGVGALDYFRRTIGSDRLIAMEIGGTSCDVTVMTDARVPVTEELDIAGYPVAIPAVDIHTVGAGGGTIAGVDAAGLLFVGPRGAGARPGPAAYGQGGSEPTITDAHLVLGRLKPGPYAGGSVTLDGARAEAAIAARVARPLGLSVAEAAAGMIRLLEQHLLHAVEKISIQRGHDPRRYVLVACGGAGPMHGAAVARRLGIARVHVPRHSGAFCAFGMLNADMRQDFARVHFARLADDALPALEQSFRALEAEADALLAGEGFAPADRALGRELDLRYRAQQWDVRVPVPMGADAAAIRAAFEAAYDRLYGHIQPGGLIEVTAARIVARGILPPVRPARPEPATAPPVPVETRLVHADDARGFVPTAVHDGAGLRPGHAITGPALIAEATTTIVIGPEDRAEVDAAGDYLIAVGGAP